MYWFGYITPNIYTQPYRDEYDLLTLECVDSISNLANMDFQRNSEISSFLEIIVSILQSTDTLCNRIYIPKTVKIGAETDVLRNLYLQQRNFIDEGNEAEKSDTVIGEILKFLGWQMMQYKDAYYIIDTASINGTENDYFEYSFSADSMTETTLDFTPRNISDIGIAKGQGTVSLDGVFNKVTVIANNNPLGTILPAFDDEDDIVNQNANPNTYYSESYATDGTNNTLLSAFFKSADNWDYTSPNVAEVTLSNRDSITNGVFWQNVDSYVTADGEPSNLSWKMYLTMVGDGYSYPSITLNNTKSMILDGGYLIIDMKYKFSTDRRAHSIIRSMFDNASTQGTCTNLQWTDDTDYIGTANWPNNTLFRCRLTIGDVYWNGSEWESIAEWQARQARYISTYGAMGIDMAGTTNHWYRYRNTYNDWEYITESTYNSLSNATKQSGECRYAKADYLTRLDSGARVYVPHEFINEYLYGGSFFLVHQNKTSENIYDTEYSLTNTVSYKMNINDATDGVAIPCPKDRSFFGQIGFTLWACDKLGTNPQPRSDKASHTLRAIHISELSISYSKTNAYKSLFAKTAVDPDVKYTNLINSGFCNELSDVTMMVNTANDIATSYSYVMEKDGNAYRYIRELDFDGTSDLAEHNLIRRLVSHYSTPKYKYSNVLKNDDLTPFAMVRETNLGKTFLVGGAGYDLTDNNVEIEGIEL